MTETLEVIRHKMEETKSDLSEKLETLEHQLLETVTSTSASMNATVEAVQETVVTVTDAIQETVHSVAHTFDLRSQYEQHPWLMIGGAGVVGYLAATLLRPAAQVADAPAMRGAEDPNRQFAAAVFPRPPLMDEGQMRQGVFPSTIPRRIRVARFRKAELNGSARSSFWYQLRDVAVGVLIGSVNQLASQSVPHVINYFVSKGAGGNGADGDRARAQPAGDADSDVVRGDGDDI